MNPNASTGDKRWGSRSLWNLNPNHAFQSCCEGWDVSSLRSTQPTGDFANWVYALEVVGQDSHLNDPVGAGLPALGTESRLSGIHQALEIVFCCFESRFIGAAINRRTTLLIRGPGVGFEHSTA